jgi:hypothetical protein
MNNLPAKPKTDPGTKPEKNPIPKQEVIISPTDDEKPTGEARKQKRYRQFRNWPNWVEVLCTVVLVGITWTYTHYAGQQLTVMRDTLNSDRPWVGIGGSGSFQLEITENGPLSITMNAQNTGKTPALNLVSVNKLEIVNPNGHIPSFEGYSKFEASPPVVLFPGSITTIHVDTTGASAQGNSFAHLSGPQVEFLKNGTVKIYAYGSIWYDDTLHTREHRTDYCFVQIPDPLKPTTANFGACKTHNYAD